MTEGYLKVVKNILGVGWAGVDLFFALSGFLITNILLNTREKSKYFFNFYMRRSLRIFPLYYVFLLVCFIGLGLLAKRTGDPRFVWITENQLWYWLYIPNWLFALNNGVSEFRALDHTWSLAIEEQFYMIWPALVYFLGTRVFKFLCMGFILIFIGFRIYFVANGLDTFALYVHTLARFDSLIWGALVACAIREQAWMSFFREHKKKLFSVSSLFVLVIIIINGGKLHHLYPATQTIGYTALSIFFSLLILALVDGSFPKLNPFFRSKPMTFFGKYSYGIYIFHVPVMSAMRNYVKKLAYITGGAYPLVDVTVFLLLTMAIYLPIALLSWHLLEKHFIKLKERFA